MTGWITVARNAEVSDDEGLGTVVGKEHVGVFRVNGKLYAIEDICPHAYALLSQGFVEGQTVECCLHGAVFDIPTGKMLKEPGGRDLKTYQVRQDGDEIQILEE